MNVEAPRSVMDVVHALNVCVVDCEIPGLRDAWDKRGNIYFCFPPRGRDVKLWAQKCIREASRGTEIILLTGAHTETQWFCDIFSRANAVCFIRGRMRFVGLPSNKSYPYMVTYFGTRLEDFMRSCSPLGPVVAINGQ